MTEIPTPSGLPGRWFRHLPGVFPDGQAAGSGICPEYSGPPGRWFRHLPGVFRTARLLVPASARSIPDRRAADPDGCTAGRRGQFVRTGNKDGGTEALERPLSFFCTKIFYTLPAGSGQVPLPPASSNFGHNVKKVCLFYKNIWIIKQNPYIVFCG